MQPRPALRFDGKVVIVTGAAGALGSAYCRMLAERGATIVANDVCCGLDGAPLPASAIWPPNLANVAHIASSADAHSTTSAVSAATSAAGARPAAPIAAASPVTAVGKLVEELTRLGARAVANYDNVLEGGKIVQCALDNFGRVDVVINNAGVLRDRAFPALTDEDWSAVLGVHLLGALRVTRAAWPHLAKNTTGGRVVMVTSTAGLYGAFGQANYAAAKLALVGLASTLALEGARLGIKVNSVAPTALSRMTAPMLPAALHAALAPAAAAPLVLCLAHEGCPESGAVFESAGGWAAKLRWERAPGLRGGPALTPEAVAAQWGDVVGFEGAAGREDCHPTDNRSGLARALENLESGNGKATPLNQAQQQQLLHLHQHGSVEVKPPVAMQQEINPSSVTIKANTNVNTKNSSTNAAADSKASTPTGSTTTAAGAAAAGASGFEAERIMALLREFLDRSVVAKTKGVFVFEVTNAAKQKRTWTLDLKHGDGDLYEGLPRAINSGSNVGSGAAAAGNAGQQQAGKADVTLVLSDEDFRRLVYNETQPQKLFLTGRLKVRGNLALALKFESVLRSMEDRARAKL